MIRPFRLRYVNQLVGSFVLLIVLLMVSGALLIAQRQDLFEAKYNVMAFLSERELGGLTVRTDVFVLGQRAGQIRDIRYVTGEDIERYESYISPKGEVRRNVLIRIELSDSFKTQIFTDSLGNVKRRLAGAGEAYIDIVRGRQTQNRLQDGGVLQIVPTKEAGQELQEMVQRLDEVQEAIADVRSAIVPAYQKIGKAAEQVQHAATDFSQTTRDLSSVADDVREIMPRLGPLVKKTEQSLDISQEVLRTVRDETDQLPGTVNQVQDTLTGAQDIIDGLRRHWLLRRYIDQGDSHPLISPSEVGRGGSWP